MKIKEAIAMLSKEYTNIEVWMYTDKSKRLHTDYVKNIDDEYDEEIEIDDYYIMDEDEYNRTILANCGEYADFATWYDDKDEKVVVIMVNHE